MTQPAALGAMRDTSFMAAEFNVLSFRNRRVPRTEWKSRFLRSALPVEHEDLFLEFLIDGLPLSEVLEVGEDIARPVDEVTDLGDYSPAEAVMQVDRLLGLAENQYGSERVWLLFCPVCHEEGCGGIGVKIDRADGKVVWSEFAWENILGDPPVVLSETQTLTFDETEYEMTLREIRSRFAGLT